jgi:hypothetical protein
LSPVPGSKRESVTKGDILVVRRFVTLTLSFCLILGVGILQVSSSFGQNEAKKETQSPKPDTSKKDTAKPDAKAKEPSKPAQPPTKEAPKAAEPTKEAPKATEAPLPPIPPEVQAKIEAARKAVAEAIVAAQDAGLVETSIDPPPILDILITGRATDARTLKNPAAKKPYGVSPEVFCAWFTGYGTLEGIDHAHDVRILHPSAGLKQWYDERAAILRNHIAEIRKAKGQTATPKPAQAKPAETKKAEPAKPAATPKPAAAKPADTPKKS